MKADKEAPTYKRSNKFRIPDRYFDLFFFFGNERIRWHDDLHVFTAIM